MMVVKIGGAAGVDTDAVLADIAEHDDVVIVHGGSDAVNEISTRLGKPPVMITSPSGHSSRRTDRDTMEIFKMVLCGMVNKTIVERLQELGRNAAGISGIDGRTIVARRKNVIAVEGGRRKRLTDDYTGKIVEVNPGLVNAVIGAGHLPVIAPTAISTENEPVNIDGDRAAAAIAGAIGADRLILLTNVPGLLRDIDDPESLITRMTSDDRDEAIALAKGRMKRKVIGAYEAIDAGVSTVIVADSRSDRPLRNALEGNGTVFVPSREEGADGP